MSNKPLAVDDGEDQAVIVAPSSLNDISGVVDLGGLEMTPAPPRPVPTAPKSVPKPRAKPALLKKKKPQPVAFDASLGMLTNPSKRRPKTDDVDTASEESAEPPPRAPRRPAPRRFPPPSRKKPRFVEVVDEDDEDDGYGDEDDGYDDEDDGYDDENDDTFDPAEEAARMEAEKIDLLSKLSRAEKNGIPLERKFQMRSDIADIRMEYQRVRRVEEEERAVKFGRRGLMAFVTGIEFLNKRYDPAGVHLTGWSETVMGSIEDYDLTLIKLYEKYAQGVEVSPEAELFTMLAGSAFFFHLTHSMFKSAAPTIQEVAKDNPELFDRVAEAVAKNMQSKAAAESAGRGIQPSYNPNIVEPANNSDEIDEQILNRIGVAASDALSESGRSEIPEMRGPDMGGIGTSILNDMKGAAPAKAPDDEEDSLSGAFGAMRLNDVGDSDLPDYSRQENTTKSVALPAKKTRSRKKKATDDDAASVTSGVLSITDI